MCVWGDHNNADDDVDMLLVCSPVHTIWCDSVSFDDKLLFPCSLKAFSSITYDFKWDDSNVSKLVFRFIKVLCYIRFLMLVVIDVSAMLSK